MKRPTRYFSTRDPLRLLLVLLLILALGLLAYLRYSTSRRGIDKWTLVPDDAVVVLETSQTTDALRRLQRSDLWPTLLAAPAVQDARELMTLIDSLHNSQRQTLTRFLTGKRLLIALHPGAGAEEGGLLLLVPVQSVRQHRYVRTLTEDLARSPRFRVTKQEIEGLLVTQIDRTSPVAAENGPVLTYASYRNILIVSHRRALVESVIQRIARKALTSPAPGFAGIDYLRLPDTWANVWISFRQLPVALGTLLGPAARPAIDELSSLGRDGLLGLEAHNENLTLKGFTHPEVAQGALARTLGTQSPRVPKLWPVVSTRTALLLHFGMPDLRPLRQAARTTDSVETTIGLALDSVVATLRDEVALCLPATADARGVALADRLAYAYAPDPLRTVRALNRLPGGRGAVETFGGYLIRPVRVPELPRRLFGPLFAGFDSTGTQGVVALVGHYAIFAPSAQSLRALLVDMAAGKVLKEAPAVLGSGQRASTLTLYVQTANAWPLLLRYLRPEHRTDALRHESFLKRFPALAFQVSRPDPKNDAFYTTLVLQHAVSGETGAGMADNPSAAVTAVTFEHALRSAPMLVRGGTGGPDVVVQDEAGTLHAVDAGGRVTWADTMAGPLVEPLFRTPTGIGRPRLLLATAARLYALEAPTGYEVENFPFYLSDSMRIQHLAAMPAEGSDFTLLVDDPAGNLYGFDLRGRPVNGWQARQLGAPLADVPRPVRVDGRDLVVLALANGDVFVLDRSGGVLPGFPVSAGGTLDDHCLAVVAGSNTRSTQLAVLTTGGQLTTFNLRGERVKLRQFPRASREARFTLVIADNGTAGVPPSGEFVVCRQEEGRVTLVDPLTGTTRLSHGFLTAAPKDVQLFKLIGGGGTIYALTERGPGKTYLYDDHDQLLAGGALDSGGPVALTYLPTTGEYVVWAAKGKTLRRVGFRR